MIIMRCQRTAQVFRICYYENNEFHYEQRDLNSESYLPVKMKLFTRAQSVRIFMEAYNCLIEW